MSESISNPPTDDFSSLRTGKPSSATTSISQNLMFNFIIPFGLLVVAGAVVLILGTVEPEKRPEADTTRVGRLRALPPVRVERLQSLESTGERLELEVDGTVVPFRESLVAAEVSGRVVSKEPECESGAYVNTGQLLMTIDDTDYKLEYQRLQRQLDQEKQSVKEAEQEIRNTQRLIDVASKDVQLQQREVDRLNSLPSGFASRAEIDQANRALLSATQQLVTVENQYELLHQRRIRLESSEKLVATQLESAALNLERTKIVAPIDGVIVSEQADVNTFVNRGSTLVTIEDTSKVEVSTRLRMDQLYWVLDQVGEKVDSLSRGYQLPETPVIIEYELSGREDLHYRWRGRLLSYDGIGLDPATRTVPVRVVVDDPNNNVDARGRKVDISGAPALVRGMYVRVKLLIQPKTPLVVIPARAMQPGNRVLQFVPDDSVLASMTREVSQDSPPANVQSPASDSAESSQPKQNASASNTTSDPFNPTRWEAGRVFLRSSIHPVDELRIRGDQPTRDTAEGMVSSERMWVCEVHGGELTGGSFVVVSPLGSVEEGEQIAVRADRDSMNFPAERTALPVSSDGKATGASVQQIRANDTTADAEDA